jgi:surface carbohydrate biosynthesis protein (TIGR04326 family)
MPQPLKGLLSLRHVAMRWPLRSARSPQWFAGDEAVFFCSYFIHLDPLSGSSGIFHSRHWEALPSSLQQHGKRANWLQLFLKSAVVPSVATGLDWVARFNENPDVNGRHAFVDSYLSWRVVVRVLKHWLRLVMLSSRLRGVRSAFTPSGSRASFWALLRNDWYASLGGAIGVDSCLSLELFDAALRELPRQPMGLYLFENHAWEKALLRSWRKYGHGRIIGVQHATAPFWYLPYFDDRRSLGRSAPRPLPLPDCVAVNGAPARRALAASGYPAHVLCDVEALRYLGVAAQRATESRAPARGRTVRVLMLGDIAPASTQSFLALVAEAAKLLPDGYELTFKPHPGYAPDLSAYPSLAVQQTHEALAKILPNHDVAVAANNTSAAIDAYVGGLPVAIALSGEGFNLSPLRGQSGVYFVGTPAELVAALRRCTSERTAGAEREPFFFTEPDLRRWKGLLGLGS